MSDDRYMIRVYEHGKAQGFLTPKGGLNRLKIHASSLLLEHAQQAVAILESKSEVKVRGCTFKIVKDA